MLSLWTRHSSLVALMLLAKLSLFPSHIIHIVWKAKQKKNLCASPIIFSKVRTPLNHKRENHPFRTHISGIIAQIFSFWQWFYTMC